jgi:hypothetical protein
MFCSWLDLLSVRICRVTGSLMLPPRSCACRITSRTERLLALPRSVNRHSAVQHSLPLPPTYLDNLISRNNPRTPCLLVHSVIPVPAMRLRVLLAGWVKHRRNRREDLVLSTRVSSRPSSRPSNRPSSRRRVASDPSTRLSNLRILACSGAAVHLQPRINRWAASVYLIISLRIVDLPYYRQYRCVWNEFQHWIYWSFWTDQYRAAAAAAATATATAATTTTATTATCFYRSVWAKSASWQYIWWGRIWYVLRSWPHVAAKPILSRCQYCWSETIRIRADPTTSIW